MARKDGCIGLAGRAAGCFALLMGMAVSGCGGGGGGGSGDSGGGDLEVSFTSASTTFNLWQSSNYSPQMDGLRGNTPNCSLTGSLPPGLSLQSRGCRVEGTPTQPGIWGGTMVLTVDGYRGSVSAPARFEVLGPTVTHSGQGGLGVSWGTSFVLSPAVEIANFTLWLTDQVSYTLVSTLPDGVSFDASAGALSGSTSLPPNSHFDFTVTATVVRGSSSVTTEPRTLRVSVGLPFFYYESAFAYPWNASFVNTPTPLSLPSGSTVGYAVASGDDLPPGIVLNLQTGVVSGMAEVFDPIGVRYWGANIVRTITSPSGETYTAEVTMWPSLLRPRYTFAPGDISNALHNIRFAPGQPTRSGAPTPVDFLPGDTQSAFTFADPMPSWLQLDPVTGELSGTSPDSAVGEFRIINLRLTVTRNGQSITTGVQTSYRVE
jgi:large repetitive protein